MSSISSNSTIGCQSNATATCIDGTDSQIKYTGDWKYGSFGVTNDKNYVVSLTSGDSAQVVFAGATIELWGAQSAGTDSTGLAVDGGNSSFVVDGTSTSTNSVVPTAFPDESLVLFRASGLSEGNHTLVFHNNGVLLAVDFLEVSSSASLSSATATSAPSVNSALATSTVTDATTSSPATTAPGSSVSSTSHSLIPSQTADAQAAPTTKRTSTGAIAGAVVGSIVLIALLLLGVLLWRRRRVSRYQRRDKHYSLDLDADEKATAVENNTVSPWSPPRPIIVIDAAGAHLEGTSESDLSDSPATAGAPTKVSPVSSTNKKRHDPLPSLPPSAHDANPGRASHSHDADTTPGAGAGAGPSARADGTRRPAPALGATRFEMDSGVSLAGGRVEDASSEAGTMPPPYFSISYS